MTVPQTFLGAWLFCAAWLMMTALRMLDDKHPGARSNHHLDHRALLLASLLFGLIGALPLTVILQLLAATSSRALTY